MFILAISQGSVEVYTVEKSNVCTDVTIWSSGWLSDNKKISEMHPRELF